MNPWPGCSHYAPASCRQCDGTANEERDFWQATPAERRGHLRQLREWHRTFGHPTQPDDETGTAA